MFHLFICLISNTFLSVIDFTQHNTYIITKLIIIAAKESGCTLLWHKIVYMTDIYSRWRTLVRSAALFIETLYVLIYNNKYFSIQNILLPYYHIIIDPLADRLILIYYVMARNHPTTVAISMSLIYSREEVVSYIL